MRILLTKQKKYTQTYEGVRIMYVLRVWYKDGTKRDFFFDSEEEREKSANWHLNSLNVERVNCFELGD